MVSHSFPSFVRDLTIYLGKSGLRVLVYAPIDESDADLTSLASSNVTSHNLTHKGTLTSHLITEDFFNRPKLEMIRYFLTILFSSVILCKRNGTDIVHGHWILPSGLICAITGRIMGIPSVITAHGRCIRYNPAADQTLPSRFYIRLGIKITSKLASKVVVCSKDSADHALRIGIPLEKLAVIHNGTNIDFFIPTANSDTVRKKFAPGGIILSVASLRKVKGLHHLIDAMSKVHKIFPDVKLVIIGEGPYRTVLSELASELNLQNNVLFLGQIDNQDLPPYYCAANVVVIPSLDEGFGVVALEAMSSGKPIIATAVGGLKEIVDTKTGMIVPPGDSNALSNAILVVLREPKMARLMGIKGRRYVGKYYNWTSTAKKISSLYSEILVKQT